MKGSRGFVRLIILTIALGSFGTLARAPLTFDERVKAQEAIERVYYTHRIWPKENPQPKPPFEEMVPRAVIEAKVADYLKKCVALEKFWQRPIRPAQLQAEMGRMASMSRNPEVLKELTAVLGNDPFMIAECLARPVLADRLLLGWAGSIPKEFQECKGVEGDRAFREGPQLETSPRPFAERWWRLTSNSLPADLSSASEDFFYVAPPERGSGGGDCRPERWDPSIDGAPKPRENGCAVWTGTEMLLWGGTAFPGGAHELWRYNPAIDTWVPSYAEENLPAARQGATAVWTGTEMLVWGGYWDTDGGRVFTRTGAGYAPAEDSWRALPDEGAAPVARAFHTAVWTGSVMIVWGGMGRGDGGYFAFGDGAMYDPASDIWTPTYTGFDTPSPRAFHTAVWTGSQMLVWGGAATSGESYNTGAAFSPSTDRWTPLPVTESTPTDRSRHGAVWTGTEMVVWGGARQYSETNSGGRFDPSSGVWRATSTGAGCPTGRSSPHALWTGSQVLVFGGGDPGGRYDPATDTWASPIAMPSWTMPTSGDTAVWTGEEMIVCGRGPISNDHFFVRGGRYSPEHDSWLPISKGCGGPETGYYQASVWTGAELVVWCSANPQYGAAYDPVLCVWRPMRSEGAPPRRQDATSVWTGREMILWGGGVNTGGRYDPIADSWMATATDGDCPQARRDHTAVWTGTEMLIWGGRSSGPLNTGARYHPTTDRWTPMATVGDCPTARYDHTAVWTGSEMILWGGSQMVFGNEPNFRTGGRYRPESDEWTPTSTYGSCPSPRYGHKAVWTGREMVVWGGARDGSGGMYDPTADRWWPTDTGEGCPKLGNGCSAVWTGLDMIVWGGGDEDWGGRYVAETGSWYPVPVGAYAPWPPRYNHVGVWTGREMIVWGGVSSWGSYSLPDGGSYCPAPTPFGAGMRFDRGWGGAPLQVTFGATASGGLAPYTFEWDFGDGSPLAFGPSPTHTFASEGVYTPTLITRDGSGASVTREGPPITVFPFPCAPEGQVSAPTEVYLGVTASFSAAVVTPNCIGETLGAWDFGDGTTASGFEATHAYAYPGIYRWTFTAAVEGFSHLSSGLVAVNYSREWRRGYGFTSNTTVEAAALADGNILLQGQILQGATFLAGLRKIDLRGQALFDRVLNASGTGWLTRPPLPLMDGGTLLAGVLSYAGANHLLLVRADAQGAAVWSKIYRPASQWDHFGLWGPPLWETPDGEILLAICENTAGRLNVLKLDSQGVPVWSRRFESLCMWKPDGLACISGDVFVLVSTSCSQSGLLLFRLDMDGNLVWVKKMGDKGYAEGVTLVPTPGADLLLVGGPTDWYPSWEQSVLVFSVTSEGEILWQRAYGLGVSGTTGAWAVPSNRGILLASSPALFEVGWDGDILWSGVPAPGGVLPLPEGDLLLLNGAEVQRASPMLGPESSCPSISPYEVPAVSTSLIPHDVSVNALDAGLSWFRWVAALEPLAPADDLRCGWPACSVTCSAEVPPEWSLGDPLPFEATLASDECSGVREVRWDFGDGATATGEGVTHAYALAGIYEWRLVATLGEGVVYRTGRIKVHPETCEIACEPSSDPQFGRSPLPVQFQGGYDAAECFSLPSFLWEFGDGWTSLEQSPLHLYEAPGRYAWTLTVTIGDKLCRKSGEIWVLGVGEQVPGDCDEDGAVSIGEVQRAVNMFLGLAPPGCGVDCSQDGTVSIGEVQKVMNGFLGLAARC